MGVRRAATKAAPIYALSLSYDVTFGNGFVFPAILQACDIGGRFTSRGWRYSKSAFGKGLLILWFSSVLQTACSSTSGFALTKENARLRLCCNKRVRE